MKRFLLLSIFLMMLTACSSVGAGFECREGICVGIEVEGPVEALTPATFTLTVKTEKDLSDLAIGVFVSPGDTIMYDAKEMPLSAELLYQDQRSIDWHINTKSETEYRFSGQVIFAAPTTTYGIFGHDIFAYASKPTIPGITNSVTIYLDSKGNQIEENQAKSALETEFPLPTMPPGMTVVPETPLPTVVWPSVTPLPSPTQDAYPAPENGDTKRDEILSTDIPAYPVP